MATTLPGMVYTDETRPVYPKNSGFSTRAWDSRIAWGNDGLEFGVLGCRVQGLGLLKLLFGLRVLALTASSLRLERDFFA